MILLFFFDEANKFDFDDNTSYKEKVKAWNLDSELNRNGGPEEALFAYMFPNNGYIITPDNKRMDHVKVKSPKPLMRTQIDADPVLSLMRKYLLDKPRNVIARVAARLREIYRKWLIKANKEKDSGKIKWYKNVLRVILKCIDFAMKKLEGIHVSYADRIGRNVDKDYKKSTDFSKYATDFAIGGVSIKNDLKSTDTKTGFDKYQIIKNKQGYYQVSNKLDSDQDGYHIKPSKDISVSEYEQKEKRRNEENKRRARDEFIRKMNEKMRERPLALPL